MEKPGKLKVEKIFQMRQAEEGRTRCGGGESEEGRVIDRKRKRIKPKGGVG